jgi:hypothetical protein
MTSPNTEMRWHEMVASWFYGISDALDQALTYVSEVWATVAEAATIALFAFTVVAVLATFGPAVLLLACGAPLWVAVAVMLLG